MGRFQSAVGLNIVKGRGGWGALQSGWETISRWQTYPWSRLINTPWTLNTQNHHFVNLKLDLTRMSPSKNKCQTSVIISRCCFVAFLCGGEDYMPSIWGYKLHTRKSTQYKQREQDSVPSIRSHNLRTVGQENIERLNCETRDRDRDIKFFISALAFVQCDVS